MREWLKEQLRGVEEAVEPVAIVLDPEAVLTTDTWSPSGQRLEADDWLSIRRAYELHGRDRGHETAKLILIVRSEEFRDARDLPWDIERNAKVLRIRIPVAPEYRALVLGLPHDLSDRAVSILRNHSLDPFGRLLSKLWGVTLPASTEGMELEGILRLVTDPSLPESIWPLVRVRLASSLSLSLASPHPSFDELQRAWEDWLHLGTASRSDRVFRELGWSIAPLFHLGLLRPALAEAPELPNSSRIGVRGLSWEEQAETLLQALPSSWPPKDLSGWVKVAEWWGQLRAVLSEGGPTTLNVAEEAWARWSELDDAFVPWLQQQLAFLMTSSLEWPATVNKIPPFLARRLRQKLAERILLVVMDGMGFTQWSILRTKVPLQVSVAMRSFAMVPTLTSVSRQAIFAGTLPMDFAETIQVTSNEGQLWSKFWLDQGLDQREIRYLRTEGRDDREVPELGDSKIVGMVVGAVDKLLHSSELLADSQIAAGLSTWAEHAFLKKLVERATAAGFEVWLTADHGNLETLPLPTVREGLQVETAGLRVRWYLNRALRDGARAEGIAWDPPGLPPDRIYPLFAPGRGAYFHGVRRVTHGGLSFDEVVVPFVQVTP